MSIYYSRALETTSLLGYGNNYGRKKFHIKGPQGCKIAKLGKGFGAKLRDPFVGSDKLAF